MARSEGSAELSIRLDTVRRLQQSSIFQQMSDEEVGAIVGIGERWRNGRGTLLDASFKSTGMLCIVAHGSVRLYLLAPDARELTIGVCQTGDAFVSREAEMDGTLMVAQVVSNYASGLHLPLDQFLKKVATCPSGGSLLQEFWLRWQVEEQRVIQELAFYHAKARLAHTLGKLARESSQRVVTASHEELASMVWARSEEITKLLRGLRTEGLIEYRSHACRRIHILDIEKLASYIR